MKKKYIAPKTIAITLAYIPRILAGSPPDTDDADAKPNIWNMDEHNVWEEIPNSNKFNTAITPDERTN